MLEKDTIIVTFSIEFKYYNQILHVIKTYNHRFSVLSGVLFFMKAQFISPLH